MRGAALALEYSTIIGHCGQSKVSNTQIPITIEEQILRLDIAMDNIRRMDEIERAQKPIQNVNYLIFFELKVGIVVKYSQKIRFCAFLDDEEMVSVLFLILI